MKFFVTNFYKMYMDMRIVIQILASDVNKLNTTVSNTRRNNKESDSDASS